MLGNFFNLQLSFGMVNSIFFFVSSKVRTLEGYSDLTSKATLIQRRLGVLVGAAVGCIVFVILVTTLAYMKVKKRRHIRQQVGFDWKIPKVLSPIFNQT